MAQPERDNEFSLPDLISMDDAEEAIDFAPVRLNLQARNDEF